MDWSDTLLALVLCHLVGDFLLQTERQATLKRGALRSGDPARRRALFDHGWSYTAAFVPVLVWVATDRGVFTAVLVGAGVAVPHVLQDGLPLVDWWGRRVKHAEMVGGLAVAVDQSFHLVALGALALVLVG